jgi:DNA polymerase elongation subunit (family B)
LQTGRILILDIETAPKVAMVWRFWKENISPKQVLEHGHIMSFAAKWLDSPGVFYYENRKEDDKAIIEQLVYFLNEADIVIAHNGDRFDIPQIKARALVHGLQPPSPVRVIDTYKVAKKEFSFPSNSLEYLTMVLDCEVKKGGHKKFPGFELWLECLRKNEEAWAELKEYNVRDVLALEEVYLRMRPWISNHPNLMVYHETGDYQSGMACVKCGSDHIHFRGYVHTQVAKFHKYQCQKCGGWGRSRFRLNKKNEDLLNSI